MKKLIALYRTPADPDAFLAHYRKTHLPLVAKIPGLIRTEVTMIDHTLLGEPGNYMLVEMHFADPETLRAAMKSSENAATGADLAKFAEGLVTVMTGSIVAA